MARFLVIGSATALAFVAALGLAFALIAGSAAYLAVHVTPAMGHPVWVDLRDRIRNPKIEGRTLTGDTSQPPAAVIRRPS